jgi:hypothetical protein
VVLNSTNVMQMAELVVDMWAEESGAFPFNHVLRDNVNSQKWQHAAVKEPVHPNLTLRKFNSLYKQIYHDLTVFMLIVINDTFIDSETSIITSLIPS